MANTPLSFTLPASKQSEHSEVNQSGQMSTRRRKPVRPPPLFAGVYQGGAYLGDALKDVPSSEDDIIDT